MFPLINQGSTLLGITSDCQLCAEFCYPFNVRGLLHFGLQKLDAWRRAHPGADGLNDIGMWDNSMADGMMTIQQEMEAFGEKMPEPKYDKNVDYSKEAEDAAYDDD